MEGHRGADGTDRSADRTAERRRPIDQSPPGRPAATSVQRRLQQRRASSSPVGPRQLDATGAILHDEEDVFVIGPPGGVFQSTTDPDVSLCVPPSAVNQTITLTMQVSSLLTKY